MDISASAATSLANTARWMTLNARVCALVIKREIVDLSGITPSFLLVSLFPGDIYNKSYTE